MSTWFRELEALRAAEVEAAAYLDAFAAAVHESPHDLFSLHALAERVSASQESMTTATESSACLRQWAEDCLALFKVQSD